MTTVRAIGTASELPEPGHREEVLDSNLYSFAYLLGHRTKRDRLPTETRQRQRMRRLVRFARNRKTQAVSVH